MAPEHLGYLVFYFLEVNSFWRGVLEWCVIWLGWENKQWRKTKLKQNKSNDDDNPSVHLLWN